MKRDNLRKIKVQLTDIDFEIGYFHEWGIGQFNMTEGIYELEDGTIATAFPECITFIKEQ